MGGGGPIELPGGLVLARAGFDVGLMTDRGEAMLRFWRDERGLPVERTLEPVPGVVQHKLTMGGAVLKVNCVEAGLDPAGRLGAARLLRLVDERVTAPVHVRDPDGNLVQLLPATGGPAYGLHLAVSDEAAAVHFYGTVLGLEQVAPRTFDVGGPVLTVGWSPDAGPTDGAASRGFGYITLQVLDVGAAHGLACSRGASELMAPSDRAFAGGSSVSFVADPDGNSIELSQRPDLVAAALRPRDAHPGRS